MSFRETVKSPFSVLQDIQHSKTTGNCQRSADPSLLFQKSAKSLSAPLSDTKERAEANIHLLLNVLFFRQRIFSKQDQTH